MWLIAVDEFARLLRGLLGADPVGVIAAEHRSLAIMATILSSL
ncbi:MAG: hypothetical protein ACTSX9_09170 [Candidatus Njordarchaeales archaeon]